MSSTIRHTSITACNEVLELELELEKLLSEEGFPDLQNFYGDQGFLGTRPEPTPTNMELAARYGLVYGEQLIYLVDSLETARGLSTRIKNTPSKGLFLLTNDGNASRLDIEDQSYSQALNGSQLLVVEEGNVLVELRPEDT